MSTVMHELLPVHLQMELDSFRHRGPGGDKAMPTGIRSALEALAPGETALVGGIAVGRQLDGRFNVAGDRNLASPWVAMQSLRSARADRACGRSPWAHGERVLDLRPARAA